MKTKFTKDQYRNHLERSLAIREEFELIHIPLIRRKYPQISESKIKSVAYMKAWDFTVLEAIEATLNKLSTDLLKRHNLVETL